jgi:hypothetical protein
LSLILLGTWLALSGRRSSGPPITNSPATRGGGQPK